MFFGLNDTVKNLWIGNSKSEVGTKIARRIEINLLKQDYKENFSEFLSWKNSIPELLEVLVKANLENLNIIFEYQSAIGKRMDALIIGYNKQGQKLVMVVELKQWSTIENIDSSHTEVALEIGGRLVRRQHPSYQTVFYVRSLQNHHELCENKSFLVNGISYLHNFRDKSQLFRGKYRDNYSMLYNNTFCIEDKESLITYLESTFQNVSSEDIAYEFLNGEYTLGKAGLDGIQKILKGEKNALMIDDQSEINFIITKELEKFEEDKKSRLIVVSGGPGTGKTILGLHIIYHYISKLKNDLNEALFTFARNRTLRQVIEGEAGGLVPILNSSTAKNKSLIVIDEAHRMNSVKQDLDHLFNGKNKVIIVLQDDKQRIMLNDNGTRLTFLEYVKERNMPMLEQKLELKIQKRNGLFSDFVNKVDSFLYFNDRTEEGYDCSTNFDINVESNLTEIDDFLKKKHISDYTAKWYAPFCWEWSQNTTINDIVIRENNQNFQKPWNPMHNQYNWYKNESNNDINQVGCIYTAQGLDYDYVGLIWWRDLKWDKCERKWVVNIDEIKDTTFTKQFKYSNRSEDEKVRYILNIYRVLLTRAVKGVRIWFVDKDTEEHFKHFFNIKA